MRSPEFLFWAYGHLKQDHFSDSLLQQVHWASGPDTRGRESGGKSNCLASFKARLQWAFSDFPGGSNSTSCLRIALSVVCFTTSHLSAPKLFLRRVPAGSALTHSAWYMCVWGGVLDEKSHSLPWLGQIAGAAKPPSSALS